MSAEDLRIRPARPQDLPGLEELETECFSEPWSPRSLQGLLATSSDLVLVVAGRPGAAPVEGYAAFRQAGDEAELLRVAVRRRSRRRGWAQRLLAEGLRRLAAVAVMSCFLEVRPDNDDARKLYARMGFRQVGVRRRYYPNGEDALLYRVRLATLNSPHGDASLHRRWPAS